MSSNKFLQGVVLSSSFLACGTSQVLALSCKNVQSGTGTVCTIDISAYFGDTYNGCVSGKTYSNTGETIICAHDFSLAMKDASTYFGTAGSIYAYQLTIGAGKFYVPDVTATLSAVVPLSSVPPPSSTVRLDIVGAGTDENNGGTRLRSNWELNTFNSAVGTLYGAYSHLTVENIHFDRDQTFAFQGTLLAVTSVTETITTVSSSGSSSQTVSTPALEIGLPAAAGDPNHQPSSSAGFNVPTANFQGWLAAGNSQDQPFIRVYDNTNSVNGTLVPTLDTNSVNNQIFFHAVCQGTLVLDNFGSVSNGTTTTATFACPTPSTGSTYTLLPGSGPNQMDSQTTKALTWYQNTLLPNASSYLVCGKNEGNNEGNFLALRNNVPTYQGSPTYIPAGQDVTLDHIVWTGVGRSAFYNTATVSITNSSIVREPAINGQAPCLSSDAGGPQFVGTSPGLTYGNVVSNYTAIATGDDSLAFGNDVGGTGTYTVSSVGASTIMDSFARAVIVTPPPSSSPPGNYMSSVDVYPYAGFASTGGTLCSGNGFNGQQGYNPAVPYPPASSCPTGGAGSNNDTITRIYQPCPYLQNQNATAYNVFCPVRVYPAPAQ